MTNPVDSAETSAAGADDGSTANDDERSEVMAAADVQHADVGAPREQKKRRHVTVYVLLPLLVMALAVGTAYLRYREGSIRASEAAAIVSVKAATDGTVALLSYRPDSAQETLTAARDRLTGQFRDSYTSLTNDVVIPGAKEKKISATATVPAASSVTASENRAVVLVFVDQSVVIGNGAPSATASAVQVTLEKIGDRWLISGFDPK